MYDVASATLELVTVTFVSPLTTLEIDGAEGAVAGVPSAAGFWQTSRTPGRKAANKRASARLIIFADFSFFILLTLRRFRSFLLCHNQGYGLQANGSVRKDAY